jgi:hypothetical protein
MPRDVKTRWNSTFEMMEFAITYQKAIDDITDSKTNGLRKYKLSGSEWAIAAQLCDVLKVSCHPVQSVITHLWS